MANTVPGGPRALARPEFLPLSVARAIWKHKVVAVAVWIALSAAGVLFVHGLPALYKAEALILVDSQKVPERFVAPTVTDDLQERLTVISQEILSASRLQQIITDLDLYRKERQTNTRQDIVDIMRRDLDIKVEKGRAFRIAYVGRNPNVAATVVNRITRLYIDQNLKSRESQAEGTTEFLETQLQEAKRNLDTLEATLSRYKVQHTGELPEQQLALTNSLARLQSELQANQESINRARQDKLAMESALAAAESAETALKRSIQRPQDRAGDEQIAAQWPPDPQRRPSQALDAELAQMRQRYTDDHPDVQRLTRRVEALRQAEQSGRASITQSGTPTKRPPADPAVDPVLAAELARTHERVTTLKSEIASTTRSITAYTEDRQRILNSIDAYQRKVEQLPVREQEMAALTRDYDISKGNYRALLDKKIAAEMASDLERRQKAERFRILDPAKPPEKPFKPKRNVLYLVSAGAALAMALLTAFAIEFRMGVLLGDWELPPGTPVLGHIPVIRPQSAGAGVPGGDKESKTRQFTVVPASLAQ